MSGFLLQLGGPLQSWGEHSAFTDRDTVSHPTRSGLIGMIASAFGIPRDQAVVDVTDVTDVTDAEGLRAAHGVRAFDPSAIYGAVRPARYPVA